MTTYVAVIFNEVMVGVPVSEKVDVLEWEDIIVEGCCVTSDEDLVMVDTLVVSDVGRCDVEELGIGVALIDDLLTPEDDIMDVIETVGMLVNTVDKDTVGSGGVEGADGTTVSEVEGCMVERLACCDEGRVLVKECWVVEDSGED